MATKSKILVIGSTGYIGQHIVAASARAGHPTFTLVRSTADQSPARSKLLNDFQAAGVTLLPGDLYDHESLVRAIKQVDVVISAVGSLQLKDQVKIIDAIKEAGQHIKRFFPSEYGNDVDRVNVVEPGNLAFKIKVPIRRATESAGIPYTYVSSNLCAGCFLTTLAQLGATAPPKEKVIVTFGDGNTKAIFVDEEDIAAYTIRAVDDPRTLNKILFVRPAANILTHNELVSLWEKKFGKTFERVYLSEEEVLKQIQEAPPELSTMLGIYYSVFINGDETNFDIDPLSGVEATKLYPDVKYTTADEYLNRLL